MFMVMVALTIVGISGYITIAVYDIYIQRRNRVHPLYADYVDDDNYYTM